MRIARIIGISEEQILKTLKNGTNPDLIRERALRITSEKRFNEFKQTIRGKKNEKKNEKCN